MDGNTLLHRQVHPSWVQNNIVSAQAFEQITVSSQTFSPTPKDNNKLSVYNGNKYTAESSYIHHTRSHLSAGVLSVLKSECESVYPLTVTEDNDPFDGHSYIDFTQVLSKGQVKAKAQKLRDLAVARNWTFKV